jgi:tetratricopeptide (TPR) repeat protein
MKRPRKSSKSPKPRLENAASPAPGSRRRTVPWRLGIFALGLVLIATAILGFLIRHRLPLAGNQRASVDESKSDYVDPAVCATCHGDVAATFRKTGMGRSFYRPTAQNTVEDYTHNNTLDHKASGFTYTMAQHDGKFFQQRHTTDFDGKETNIVEEQVDYVIGSGNHARTYLHRTPEGKLTELPVSWYTEHSGSWGMSPGYDQPDQADIGRTIPPECMFCHNGFPRIDQDAARVQTDNGTFPANLPEGIDCQRCHGPGRGHVAAASASKPDARLIRSSIVNPGELPRDRQLEVCMQCHLETSSSNMPNQIRAYDRGVFSYRPGQPLGDYALYFDRAKPTTDDTFEVAHQAYRLRKSKCFLNSNMTCLTCHDPHDVQHGKQATAAYLAVCQSCHQAVVHRAALPAGSDCLSCHMPKRRTDDVVHVVMTDHFIRRNLPAHDLLAPLVEKSYVDSGSAVVPYYPPDAAKAPGAELTLAVAQVNDRRGDQGLKHLEDVISRQKPSAPEPYFELGKAFLRKDDKPSAVHWLQAALQRRQDYRPALLEIGPALLAVNQDAKALETLQHAIATYPNDDMLLANLGNVYLRMNMLTEARAALDRAIAANPERAEAYNLLGLLALQSSDKGAAEKSFREAIRWNPNLEEAHSNLGILLTGSHQFEEARFHFAKAISLDPKSGEAHHGLGLLFILTNAVPDATAQLRDAARLQPDSAQIHSDLADVLAAQGQTGQAAQEYEQVLRLKPGQADAHLGLGLALLQEHRVAEARVHLEKAATSADPDISQAATRALSQLGY